MKVLVVIDMQKDFVDGALGSPEAQAIVPNVAAKVKEYAEMADHSVVLPEECDGILGVYGCAIFSQLFACLLAIERGYNPDFPVGLSKVTVTR